MGLGREDTYKGSLGDHEYKPLKGVSEIFGLQQIAGIHNDNS